jgi:hypothetical protein
MLTFWIFTVTVFGIVFCIHCFDWMYLIRHRQLLSYFVHAPLYFVGDLASIFGYILFLALGTRQALGVATHREGLIVFVAMCLIGFVGIRRANQGLASLQRESEQ